MNIFISYKRESEPDLTVVQRTCNALKSGGHRVFIDHEMLVGIPWAERIEKEIRESDFLITFLSERSVNSEMVRWEIEKAHEFHMQEGHPRILPVRLAYREPFKNPLGAWLNPINWALWDDHEDTPRLVSELLDAISGKELHIDAAKKEVVVVAEGGDPASTCRQPSPSSQPEAATPGKSAQGVFYVERDSDKVASRTIKMKGGVTITIKAPRQMGKSLLLGRTLSVATQESKRTASLDFQLVDKDTVKNAEEFYRQFCFWITDVLDMEDKVDQFWHPKLSNPQNCTRYMERYILKSLGNDETLVLAIDEADKISEADFSKDFFAMLRSWHVKRNDMTDVIWNNLDLVLVISTEPYELINNHKQSPFNVGEIIDLKDFDDEKVVGLNERYGFPLDPEKEIKGSDGRAGLMRLLHGHPYLTRRALYLVANQDISKDGLFRDAAEDRGPFGDHLRYHLLRLLDQGDGSEAASKLQEGLIRGFTQVLKGRRCDDEMISHRLYGAGLVREEGEALVPRCQLYEAYFGEKLHV